MVIGQLWNRLFLPSTMRVPGVEFKSQASDSFRCANSPTLDMIIFTPEKSKYEWVNTQLHGKFPGCGDKCEGFVVIALIFFLFSPISF